MDRLISVANDSEQVSYTYDELNRRLSKKVASSSQQTEERYLYAGQDEIGACDPQGNITQLRVLGIGRGAEIGAAIAIELNGQAFAPIHDHNGNVASLLDNVGNVFETYRYSAFGEEQIYDTNNAPIDASINPWRFSSKRFDPETGFINFGRRYYSPSIGRFVTADPIGYEAGPNLYAYVLNNPLTHLDLYGLWATPCDDDRVINVLRERDGERHRQFEAERRENYYNHFGVHDFQGEYIHLPHGCNTAAQIDAYLDRQGIAANTNPFHVPNSDNYYIENGVKSRNAAVLFVNGILTPFQKCLNIAQRFSCIFGHHNIHFTHNQTRGIVLDILECIAHIVGIPTHSEKKLTEHIRERIESVGGVGSNGLVYLIAHSQGGLILSRAL